MGQARTSNENVNAAPWIH